MYRSTPFRSTLNTNAITALDMCKVCTEAVQFPPQFPQFRQPLHAFMARRRFFVFNSAGPCLQIRQPFHNSMFGMRQFRRPLQGRRISRMPKTTSFLVASISWPMIHHPLNEKCVHWKAPLFVPAFAQDMKVM